MTIEMIGGEVVARTKAKGSKRKPEGDQPAPAPKKGKRKADAPESAPTDTAAPAPSRRGKKKDASTEPASLNATTPGRDAAQASEPPASTGATLTDLAAGYIAHLEATGKSEGTVFSYRLELAVAMNEIGKDTAVRELTAERILAFFTSERVTKTRLGRTKSPLSIDKTRRVLRQALQWAVERSIADATVIPAN